MEGNFSSKALIPCFVLVLLGLIVLLVVLEFRSAIFVQKNDEVQEILQRLKDQDDENMNQQDSDAKTTKQNSDQQENLNENQTEKNVNNVE